MSKNGEAFKDWSARVTLDDVPPAGLAGTLSADAETRDAIASAFDLQRLDRLEVRLEIGHWRKGLVVAGTLEAIAERICVVSLEPFLDKTKAAFERRYLPPAAGRADRPAETALDPLADDEPDVLPPEGIDLSALVREEFALALDPHPRRPGVEFDNASRGDASPDAAALSPFAALKALVRDDDGDPQ